MSCLASSMKYVPILLPTPREPLWSMNQTRSASSRQTSMKWLPVPSVPRCTTLFEFLILPCLLVIAANLGSRRRHASTAGAGGFSQAPLSRPRAVRPCGTARSIAARTSRRLSGRSLAVKVVRSAAIPQPMSTPTAAGMMAPTVGMTLPTVAPTPQWTSGIAATQPRTHGRRATLCSCFAATSSRLTPRIHALIGTPPSTSIVSYVRSVLMLSSGALRHGRIPRRHQVELERLDPAARPEYVADDSHVLVSTESLVVALRQTTQVDRDRRCPVGRRQGHRLAAEIDPEHPAVDDQRRLWNRRRLSRRLHRENGEKQAEDDHARDTRS